MKKTVIFIALVLLAVFSTFAQVSIAGQTFYYKYVSTEDSDTGVRSKGADKGMYLTFTRNACYESDANGIQKGSHVYTYQKDDGSRFIFLYRDLRYGEYEYRNSAGAYFGPNGPVFTPPSSSTTKVVSYDYQDFLSFSKDYKKFSRSIYHGKTETTGTVFNFQGTVTDNTRPGKAAYWEKGIEIWEQSAPPPPPKTKEELDREAQEKLAPPKVNF